VVQDQRVADVDTPVELAYQALVRIPFGTAVMEEFAFRGVLVGLPAGMGPMKTAVAVSSCTRPTTALRSSPPTSCYTAHEAPPAGGRSSRPERSRMAWGDHHGPQRRRCSPRPARARFDLDQIMTII
jgi:hypothetical protein